MIYDCCWAFGWLREGLLRKARFVIFIRLFTLRSPETKLLKSFEIVLPCLFIHNIFWCWLLRERNSLLFSLLLLRLSSTNISSWCCMVLSFLSCSSFFPSLIFLLFWTLTVEPALCSFNLLFNEFKFLLEVRFSYIRRVPRQWSCDRIQDLTI